MHPVSRKPAKQNQSNKDFSVKKFLFSPQVGLSFTHLRDVFTLFAASIAEIFISLGLLPKDYLKQLRLAGQPVHLKNIIETAYKALPAAKKDIHKVVLFYAVCGTLVFIMLAVVLSFFGLFFNGAAHAQGAGSFPDIPTGVGDEFLGQIFGTNGGQPLQVGIVGDILRDMLRIYSNSALMLAGLILVYIVIAKTLDTAQSGTPFGKSFSHTWAPIRLVVAIGLLIPLGSGLNSGQYIVLSLAKMGSNLAGTAWSTASSKLALSDVLHPPKAFLNMGVESQLSRLLKIRTCQYENNHEALLAGLKPDIVPKMETTPVDGNSAIQSVTFSSSTLGGQGKCGVISWPIKTTVAEQNTPSGIIQGDRAEAIFKAYSTFDALAKDIAAISLPDSDEYFQAKYSSGKPKFADFQSRYNDAVKNYKETVELSAESSETMRQNFIQNDLQKKLQDQGWMSAGLYLFALTKINSTYINDIGQTPSADYTAASTPSSAMVDLMSAGGGAGSMDAAYMLPGQGDYEAKAFGHNIPMSGLFSWLIKKWQLTETLAEVFEYSSNNPLGDIMARGQWFVSYGTKMIVGTVTGEFFGKLFDNPITGFVKKIPVVGNMSQGAQNFYDNAKPLVMFVATTFILAGVLLGFLIPILPTMRFLFGILGWLLGLFFALLAVPLVALSHLRTTGEGFVPDQSFSAYLMILGVVLQPLLMVIGMIVGIISFNTIISLLNMIWVPMMNATTTSGVVGLVGWLVFFFLYVSTATILSNSAFKAIDLVPRSVMEYINARMPDTGNMSDTTELLGTGGAALKAGAGQAVGIAKAAPGWGAQMGENSAKNLGISKADGPFTSKASGGSIANPAAHMAAESGGGPEVGGEEGITKSAGQPEFISDPFGPMEAAADSTKGIGNLAEGGATSVDGGGGMGSASGAMDAGSLASEGANVADGTVTGAGYAKAAEAAGKGDVKEAAKEGAAEGATDALDGYTGGSLTATGTRGVAKGAIKDKVTDKLVDKAMPDSGQANVDADTGAAGADKEKEEGDSKEKPKPFDFGKQLAGKLDAGATAGLLAGMPMPSEGGSMTDSEDGVAKRNRELDDAEKRQKKLQGQTDQDKT